MIQDMAQLAHPAKRAFRNKLPVWGSGFQNNVDQNTPVQKLVQRKQLTSLPIKGICFKKNSLTGLKIEELTTIVVIP